MKYYNVIFLSIIVLVMSSLYRPSKLMNLPNFSLNTITNQYSDTIITDQKRQGNPYITNYPTNNPDRQIWKISHDNDGQMIFAHRQGITIYNGSEFSDIKLQFAPLCIIPFEDENIMLVGCENDYGFLEKKNTGDYVYKSLSNKELRPGEISDIKITPTYIYFYSEESILRHHRKTLKFDKSWFVQDGIMQNGILQLGDQIFISKKNKGLFRLDPDGKKEYIPSSKSFSSKLITFSFLISKNKLLIGTEGNNLYLFNGKKLNDYDIDAQKYLNENQLVGGIDLSEERYVLSTLSGGVLIIDKKNSKIESIINYHNGLPDDEIFAMGKDLQGGLWLSHGLGLSRLNYKLPIQDYSQYPGIEGNIIDITEFENTLYIATSQGVYYLDSIKSTKEFEYYIKKQNKERAKEENTLSSTAPEEKIIEKPEKKKGLFQRMKENREKRKKEKEEKLIEEELIEENSDSENKSVDKKEEIESEDLPEENHEKVKLIKIKGTKLLKLSYVFRKVANISGKCRQLIKANNTLLVASNNGLYGIEKGKSKLIIKNLYVNTIQPSKTNGIFYIGTDKGITAIKSIKNSWKEFKKIKPKDFSDAVFSIAEDEDQNIWVATGDLVYYFVIGKDLTTKSYEIFDLERESQSRISIRQIEDQTYFLSSKQIFRYITSKNKIEIDSYILSQVPSFVRFIVSQPEISWFQNGNNDWIFLGKKHKLSKFQVSLLNLFENIQTIKVDQNQNLWIIDRNNSFYKIKPTDSTETYIKDFKVYLEKIQDENGNSISLEKILIPFETKTVTFKISAPYYLRPEGIKYQYFIEEKMNSWSEWKSSPTFDFLVYPGKYKLKLRAKNIFGNISESQDYIINVKTPVWMKPWFKIALTAFSIIIIALIIILILKKRERILQRDNKRLEEKVAERTSKIIKQKEQIELKNKEITNSLNYASQIQSAILPPVKIIKDAVDECFIINKPKDIVSGDFYWAANIHGKLIVTAADCTGHGVPGAFLSLLGVTFLNEISMKIVDLQANLILEKLRARVIRSLHQQGFDKKRLDGIDLSLAIIDLKSMELQFAGANNPLYIIRNGHLTEFRGNRMPIGVQSLKIEPFTNHLIEIKKGDKVYMFSDGYTDQFGGELGKKFLSRNFKTLLEEICILPLKEQKKTLIETFELWKGRFEQIDDVLVIGLKI